jgi:Mg-chelatase subunit ChlD
MGYSSKCDWWQFKFVSGYYQWVFNTTYNQTQTWCIAKNQTAPHQSVWTGYSPVKITAAKTTANNFLSLLGIGDQSALVSFANNATLDKTLSNNHSQTQTAVNSLITFGATDIGDAISLGTGELTSTRINPAASQIMILLTDGMANKPSGPGYGEYAPDVAYALTKAGQAAAASIKIFTIGLGGEINATMLQQIASSTGGQYYFAPTAAQLQEVFDQITLESCR